MTEIKKDRKSIPSIDQPVGVLGVGVEGRATIDYLLANGISQIEALDGRTIENLPETVTGVFGEEHNRNLSRFATIFRSPGIRPDHPSLLEAMDKGTRVTSALSCFMERCPCPVIGFTGTVGKGTASSLAAKAMEDAGYIVHLGGNIGKSPLEFLHKVKPEHRAVLEISSFQAMDISRSPHISVILKTTSEHLDWHTSTDEYRSAKAALLKHQVETDFVIYNEDSDGSVGIGQKSAGQKYGFSLQRELNRGIFLKNNQLVFQNDNGTRVLPIHANRVNLPGDFNMENVAAGLLAAILAGAQDAPACESAARFGSLPHRLELAATGDNIQFYNDSYATRPEAAIAAVGAFDAPLALILGGSEKNADFSELVQTLEKKENIRSVGLIGATAPRLLEAIERSTVPNSICCIFETLEDAMTAGQAALVDGGVLLLSPACASFGMFKNYKDRGEKFRRKAATLAKK